MVISYGNSLNGPFFVDDVATVVDNASVHDWGHLRDLIVPREETPLTGRPLVALSFIVNYHLLRGRDDVRGYHVVNIAVHLAAALLLFGLVRRTLEQPPVRARLGSIAMPAAFCAAVLWAVHPLNTEAVDYITQRTEIMMGFFFLATVYASVRAVDAPGWRWSATAIACCAAGMACKETMVAAPLAVVLVDRAFVFDSMRHAFRARWRLYAGLVATWGVLLALLAFQPGVRSAGFSTRVGVWTYLLNQTVMIVHYLRLTMWPTSLVVNYGWPLPLHVGDVWPQALVVIGLLAAIAVGLWTRPALSFAGAWFFLTLTPTSSFLPIATEVGAERRMYVPLMGLAALAAVAAMLVWQRQRHWPAWRAGGWAAMAVITVGLMVGTIQRNREYRSSLTLAETSVERWPSSVGEHVLGTELALAGNKTEAVTHFKRALPDAPRAYYSLGMLEFGEQHWDEAIEDFRAFLQAEPLLFEAISARLGLGQALGKKSQWSEAIEQARLVLTMHPSRDDVLDARLIIADGLRGQQAYDAAVAQYQAYVEARPNDARGATGLAISFVGLNRTADAAPWFRRAAELSPDDAALQRNAAMALLELSRVADAAVYADRAARLRPNDAVAHDLLGLVLLSQQKAPAAIEQFQLALRLNPNAADVRDHLSQAMRSVRAK